MSNQFFSPEGDIENYYVSEYTLIDQYIGDKLYLWGSGDYAYGVPNVTVDKLTPITTFAGGNNWKQVDAGIYVTAAVKTDGTLWVWGFTFSTGSQLNSNSTETTPVTTFVGGNNWKQVSCGNYNTAAIKTDGTLWTWGNRTAGQVGRLLGSLTPETTFAGGTNWADTATGAAEELYTISSGFSHSAAIKTDGTLWIWGDNYRLQLGHNRFNRSPSITPITTFAGGTNWKQVSCANRHTAAIKTDGTLWVWGNGGSGRLGTNGATNRSTPVTTFAGGTDWKQVSAGISGSSTVAIKTDGTLWVWGDNTGGILGTNDTSSRITPVTTFAGGTDWKQVSSGTRNTAAIKTDGTLWVWGNTFGGVLGNNQIQNNVITPITTFAGGTNWNQVSIGDAHISAIKTDGTLWVWGNGLIGINETSPFRNTPITTFAGGTNWADTATGAAEELYTLSAADGHASAIKTDGTLWAWGNNSRIQLGINVTGNRSTPVTTFSGGTDWKQVSSGDLHTAAIKTDGTLWTWGYNSNLQLGTNDAITRSTPVTTFAGGTNWKQVSSGTSHTVAIKTDGTLWVWGNNSRGQLGTNDTTSRTTPSTTFTGGTDWKHISGGRACTAAIKTDGTLWTWGFAFGGVLGNNISSFVFISTPVTTFAGGTNWKQVKCGGYNTAAIKTDGTLWIWGTSGTGHLGNNGTTSSPTPVTTFAGGTDWKQVSLQFRTFGAHVSAVKTDGTLWTWGYNDLGQLGTGDVTDRLTPVTTFAGGTNWKQTSCGTDTTFALKDDGVNKELFAFGETIGGLLGNNDSTSRVTPITTFAGGTDWKQVNSGYRNTVAIKTDGTLWVWGNATPSGYGGLLGNNNNDINSLTPITTFTGGTNWKQVFCGANAAIALRGIGGNKELFTWGTLYTGTNKSNLVPGKVNGENWKVVTVGTGMSFAIKNDGTLWTWGYPYGTLSGIAFTPVTTFAGGTDWKQVALNTGSYHVAAIKTDGTLWVWGSGDSGQLGNNNILYQQTPVTTFAGGTDWKQVATSRDGTAAIKTDGTLWLWGRNSGNLKGRVGNNQSTDVETPVTTFAGGTNWKQVALGYDMASAIKTDGTIWGWGWGWGGQLGNNVATPDAVLTPVTIFGGGNDWKQTTCGYHHVAAIKSGVSPNS